MQLTLVQDLVNGLTWILATIGLAGLFSLMLVESVGIPPLPSEVILPFAGFLVAEGVYGFGPAVLVAVLGGVAGAYIAYAIGRWGRGRLTTLGIGRLRVAPSHLERMDSFFARRGEITVGLARLVPVVRAYISYPAGTARMSPVRFGLFTALGSIPYAVGFIYAGMVLQSNWDLIAQQFAILNYILIAGLVAVVIYFILVAAGVLHPSYIEPPAPKGSPAPTPAPPRSP